MSPPHRSCIFPGCHSVQGNSPVSLFKVPKDDNIRKRWIDFVKRSYSGELKITTNTRLCSVHFTPDSYSNCHQVKSGYLKSPLMLVSGAELTLSIPGLHPPIPPTAHALIPATGQTLDSLPGGRPLIKNLCVCVCVCVCVSFLITQNNDCISSYKRRISLLPPCCCAAAWFYT